MDETVKGFNDFTGEDALKRSRIMKVIEETFRLYGFEPAETPVIEYEDFVKGGNSNDEAVSDIYRLSDKGERKLALRYEFTFQLKRISKNKKLPFKRYQIGPVFRDEPTSSNRFRQFTQCDADIVGSTLKDEAELLKMTDEILAKLGINSVICINNRKLLNDILAEQKVDEKDRAAVIKEIDKLGKIPESEIIAVLKKYKAEKILAVFKKPESYFEKYASYSEIAALKKLCKEYGVKVEFSPSLARGLSYYNGTIFEVKTKAMKETICGGGSFPVNNLQSFGISLGIERISVLAKIEPEKTKLLIISINQDKEAVKLADFLRENKIACTLMFGKPSKALEYANSYSLPYAVFLGEDEIKKKKVKLRNMKTGKEEMVSSKDLIKKLI